MSEDAARRFVRTLAGNPDDPTRQMIQAQFGDIFSSVIGYRAIPEPLKDLVLVTTLAPVRQVDKETGSLRCFMARDGSSGVFGSAAGRDR